MSSGSVEVMWDAYDEAWTRVSGEVIGEVGVTINVNGDELVSLMATPAQQAELALGLLYNEGLMKDLGDLDQAAFDKASDIIHKGQEAAERMLPVLRKKLGFKKRRFQFPKR